MKMIKKIAAAAAVIALGAGSFAQTSYKNTSTTESGLFKTDVDKFMSTTNWQDVKADNLFGYLGYGITDSNLNFGAAHQFDGFYGAAYFSGRLDSFNTSASTTTPNTGDKKKSSNLTSVHDGSFYTAALLGLGNNGFKFGLSYTPTNINNTDTSTGDNKGKNYTERFYLRPALNYGTVTKINKRNVKIDSGLALTCNVNKTVNQTEGDSTINKTDNSTYVLNLNTDWTWDGKKGKGKNPVKNTYGVYASTNFNFVGLDDTANRKHGAFANTTYITPRYIAEITPVPQFTLKARAALQTNIGINFDEEYTTDSDGNKTYNTAGRDESLTLGFTPTLNLAAVYQIKPNKFDFNIGTSMVVPDFDWKFYTTKVYANDGSVTSKTTGADFNFDSASGSLTWYSGFTWYFGKTVTLDCFWDIIDNMVGNLATSFNNTATAGNGMNVFFMNINNVIFTNVAIQVTMHL